MKHLKLSRATAAQMANKLGISTATVNRAKKNKKYWECISIGYILVNSGFNPNEIHSLIAHLRFIGKLKKEEENE